MSRYKREYDPAYQERACRLALVALGRGWSIRKFGRWAGIPGSTVKTWLMSERWFVHYTRALQEKAMDLPQVADDIVRRVIEGRRLVGPDGTVTVEKLDPAAARVALRHLEFRMMRELKSIYQMTAVIEHRKAVEDLTDEELDQRYQELVQRQREEAEEAGRLN